MQEQSTQSPQPKTANQSENRKGSKRLLLILLWIFTVLLFTGLGIGGYWFLTKDRAQNCPSETQAKTCTYDGKTYNDGDSFEATDGCNSCFCNNGAVSCTEMYCEEETPEGETIEPEEKIGSFEVNFSYPSDFVPTVRLCFENIEDISKHYCFFHPNSLSTDSYSTYITNKGNLPVGKYYAYMTVYLDNDPAITINLNKCNYSQTQEEIDENCQERIEQSDARKTACACAASCSVEYMTNANRNSKLFSGERIIFEIKENQTTDIGLLNTLHSYY